MMIANHEHYAAHPARAAQICRFWSGPMDALERHLSANTWALAAVSVALCVYPIARMVMPTVLHAVVPNVVRTALNLF